LIGPPIYQSIVQLINQTRKYHERNNKATEKSNQCYTWE